jgi:hypothetical protein
MQMWKDIKELDITRILKRCVHVSFIALRSSKCFLMPFLGSRDVSGEARND